MSNNNGSTLITLDDLDYAILSHLREDGRKSFTELADVLEVSVGTIRNRYARLVDNDVLQVYGRVNPEQVGVILYAQIFIVVRPTRHIESILNQLVDYPEVSFLAVITGEYDIELNVMCRDHDHLNSLVNDRIAKIEGVYFTRTNMYLRLLKTAQPDIAQLFPPEK